MLLHMLALVLAVSGQPVRQSPPPQAQQATPAAAQRPVRKLYNDTADAKAQIADALKAAEADDIRVLINWGANDDDNCAKFQQSLRGTPMSETQKQVSVKLSNEYRLVFVDVGHLDKNQDLAAAYKAVLAAGSLPHFTILDKTGKVMEQRSARDFAADTDPAKFDAEKVLALLVKNQVPPTDSAPLFAAALKQAKAGNKEVFLWFSAPW
jgi:thioredoxin-related protein